MKKGAHRLLFLWIIRFKRCLYWSLLLATLMKNSLCIEVGKLNFLVSTSVFCRDCEQVLSGTLQSLNEGLPYAPIFLIDGGSRDSTRKIIRKWQKVEPRFVGLQTKTILNAAEAHNMVRENLKSQYHLLMDPYSRLQVGDIDALVKVLDRNPEIGSVTPGFVDHKGNLLARNRRALSKIDWAIDQLSPRVCRPFFRERLDRYFLKEEVESNYDIPSLPVGFTLIRTELMQRLNGLNSMLDFGLEMVDLGVRIKSEGVTNLYYPAVKVQRLNSGRDRYGFFQGLTAMKQLNEIV